MKTTKLSDCKTLDDFNEFSKRVHVNGKSAGRSFTYVNPDNGRKRSYSMNQIVHQFDKCIKTSKKTATNNLCAEVNEGLDAIDQWNAEADRRTNTSLLLPRKWLGNGWYSLTHLGKNKNKTLAKIRAAYPKVLANIPQLPSDVINLISLALKGNANESDILAFAGVNKASYARHLETEAENDAIIEKYGILGRKQWQAFGVEIGNPPPLPEGVEEIMESDCPIWAGKKVMDTHALVLMPETIDGKPLTLKSIETFIKKTFRTPCEFHDAVITELGDNPSGKSYWFIMTKEPISGSLNKKYINQEALVADLSLNSLVDYEVPLVLEAIVLEIALTLKNKDTRLYKYHFFTRCQETVQAYQYGYQVKVDNRIRGGMQIKLSHPLGNDDVHTGVAACRKF